MEQWNEKKIGWWAAQKIKLSYSPASACLSSTSVFLLRARTGRTGSSFLLQKSFLSLSLIWGHKKIIIEPFGSKTTIKTLTSLAFSMYKNLCHELKKTSRGYAEPRPLLYRVLVLSISSPTSGPSLRAQTPSSFQP